jgi:anti-sigma factor RsiW
MPHLDEGTIHAWIEGALPPDEAAMSEEHIAGCDECSAAVAEARGLIAASSRILTALDDVPGGVIPSRALRARPWYMRRELQAAAAVLVVAGTTLLLMNGGRQQETTASRATFAVTGAAIDTGVPAPSPAATSPARAAESGKREPMESKVADAAARMPAVSKRSLQKPTERNQAGETAEPRTVDAAKLGFGAARGAANATVNSAAPKSLALAPAPAPPAIDSPIRVVSVERRIGWGPRTTYEISPGVQVVLTEKTSTRLEALVVVPREPAARAAESGRLRSVQKEKEDSVPVICAQDSIRLQPQINSIQWKDPETSDEYTLTGPLTCEQLKRVKARLGEASR